ncbi:ABC transporter ATP-binding protein [Mogibacterium diversum]|uniref:ABC transporter ATP-binding protein n=1 Tax=Mogibacterium diversum TaxID=114527 RepID=UPI0026EF33E3|nr:ABC transporter ATP-binding protein [Mogibacterium diversum]
MKDVMEARNLTFAYEGEHIPVLEDVNFSIAEGSIVFISGLSGSGKSTLINVINGLIPEIIDGKLRGELLIGGKSSVTMTERSMLIGNVFQNPRSQFFTTNTTAELVFAMENFGVSKPEMERRLKALVKKYKLEYLLDRDIYELSSGERQMLALMSALIMNPHIVIFDEPSANLDYGNAMRLRRQIEELKSEGITVLVADHRCFYLRGLVDKVLLLNDNTVTEYESEEAYFSSDYAARAVKLFDEKYESRLIARAGPVDVRIENVSYKGILQGVSAEFRRGEISTIVGVNGAGKTTLARLISLVVKPDDGIVETEGQALYIMQDADYQLFGASCIKELEISSRDEELNTEALKALNLYEFRDAHPYSLSGGQKQRLQMAISRVSQNKVIILDEPTSGLDKRSMHRVVDQLESMKRNHTIIIISHDYEFIRNISDRIFYLEDGRIRGNFYLDEDNISQLNKTFEEMEAFYE